MDHIQQRRVPSISENILIEVPPDGTDGIDRSVLTILLR